MKTMTQRKQYARPQMTVVELRHQCCILAGSGNEGLGATRGGYGAANTANWGDEE